MNFYRLPPIDPDDEFDPHLGIEFALRDAETLVMRYVAPDGIPACAYAPASAWIWKDGFKDAVESARGATAQALKDAFASVPAAKATAHLLQTPEVLEIAGKVVIVAPDWSAVNRNYRWRWGERRGSRSVWERGFRTFADALEDVNLYCEGE